MTTMIRQQQQQRQSVLILVFVASCVVLLAVGVQSHGANSSTNDAKHTNNWAVIVDTSRFWFNYRHAANVLSIYRSSYSIVVLSTCQSHIILT